MRMIAHLMDNIAGIEIFPMIALGIFMLFFILLLLYILGLKKEEMKEFSELPLNDGTSGEIASTNTL